MKSTKWKKFARVAEAIERVRNDGAVVKWNSRLAGARFDVVIRSTYERHEFLIVVNCLDVDLPVTPTTVKAFARKVELSGAHMGVMASSSGYEEEAFNLSADHSVALLDGATMDEMSELTLADTFRPAMMVYNFRFVAENKEQLGLPEEPPVLRFFMREIRVKGPGLDTFPEKMVNEARDDAVHKALCRPQDYEIPVPAGTVFIHPNSQAEVKVNAFMFTYRLIPKAELLEPEAHFEDHYGVTENSLREQLAKRNPTADSARIGLGFDTVLRPTRYYYNPQLQFSYYCEEVTKGQAKIVLVESYQNGKLMQARFTISRPQYQQFVEVTEPTEIARLTKLYDVFSVSDKNLEARFKVFLRDLEETEPIDELTLTMEQRVAPKADYFFANRNIVGELKALYEDTTTKIDAILDPYRNTPDWPILFGEQEVERVLQHLPDRDRLRVTIFRSITRSIEAVVEKANRQIRETKRTFGLPDAGGLLIILNDAVDILSPDVVVYRVRRALNKRTADGALRYANISAVLIIGGAHYTQLKPDLKGMPMLTILNLVPETDFVEEFTRHLSRKWAAFERQPLIPIGTIDLPKLRFRTVSADVKDAAQPVTRQDYWSALYKRNPYLRPLSEDELLEFGGRVLEEVSANLIKGAPKRSIEEMGPNWIRWSNFLDEVPYRGTDMRKLVKKTEGLGDRMEALYQRYQAENNCDDAVDNQSAPRR